MPAEVRRGIGYALRVAQDGGRVEHAKRMSGALRDVMEITEHDGSGRNTFRLMYTTAIGEDVHVLDAFQKKSKTGATTPGQDVRRIEMRLHAARRSHATK